MSTSEHTTSRPGIEQKVLRQVRALLAKAESTTFPSEAEALTAKAQQLMARHAIDRALVEASAAGGGGIDEPCTVHVGVGDPYAASKAALLNRIAMANRCRSVHHVGQRCSTLFGYPADLEGVELLYTSLLVQGTVAIRATGSQRSVDGRSTTRSFRSSFWMAYAQRIGERLAAAQQSVVDAAVLEHGQALVPVLVSRLARVERARDEAFPHLTRRRARPTNAAGWVAGSAAADRADLAQRSALRRGR